MGQDEGPSPLQAVVDEEPLLPPGEVALPLLVVENLDIVQGLSAAAIFNHEARWGFFPIVPMKLAGSGRRSSLSASRGTMAVANPCFGM
jgi:hypothetical protein